jgi:GNAT superfamily N-acetyltransferase
MSSFTIRPAASSDARDIAEIHYAGWQIAYAQIITAEEMASRLPERRVAFWLDRIADPADLVLIAVDTHGTAQGFMHGGRVLEHDIRTGSLAGYDCEIYSLHCRQAVHGRGLGRLLMAETARIFRDQGRSALVLWAFRDNSYRAFYEKNGGQVVAEGFDGEIPDVAYGWPLSRLITTGAQWRTVEKA